MNKDIDLVRRNYDVCVLVGVGMATGTAHHYITLHGTSVDINERASAID